MKKIFTLILATCLCALTAIIISGCSSNTPSSVVKEFLGGLQKQDTAVIKSVFDDGDLKVGGVELDDLFDYHDADLPEETKAFLKDITAKLTGFDYVIDSETTNGDNANVFVTFTTYDFGSAMTSAFSNAITKAVALSISGATEDQIEATLYNEIASAFNQLTDKTVTSQVTFSLHKTNGEWKMDALTDIILNSMFGNIFSASATWQGWTW